MGVSALALLAAACSAPDRIASPSLTAIDAPDLRHDQEIPPGVVRVCKASGPAGAYTFALSATGGGDWFFNFGPLVTVNFDGTNVACMNAWMPFLNSGTWTADMTATVTATELVPDGMHVTQIDVLHSGLQASPPVGFAFQLFNTNTVTVTVHRSDLVKLFFHNAENPPPPPPPGNGCTPGYWKVKQHWDSWAGTGYTTTQLISSVFTVPAGLTRNGISLGAYTMVQGLSFQGGSTVSAKAEILLRASVAAVLNAGVGLSYGLTTAQVIAQVNAALASGDGEIMLNLATTLDELNNAGCPLN